MKFPKHIQKRDIAFLNAVFEEFCEAWKEDKHLDSEHVKDRAYTRFEALQKVHKEKQKRIRKH